MFVVIINSVSRFVEYVDSLIILVFLRKVMILWVVVNLIRIVISIRIMVMMEWYMKSNIIVIIIRVILVIFVVFLLFI